MPPKSKTKKKELVKLTETQVFDVLEFAKNLYGGNYPQIYTPDLVNQRMKDINLNPLVAEEKNIEKALMNPKDNESNLIGYSEYFQMTSMLYKRMIGYMALMPSFDYTFTCINAKLEDYKSKAYQKDLDIVYSFLDKFDVRREFKKIMLQLLTNEIYYGVLRDDAKEKYIFQELPYTYCKITGKCEYSFLFDFNMLSFISNPGMSLDMFPQIFKKYYKRVMDNKNNGYNPASNIDKRNGEWIYWVQTSIEDGMFAFKFNTESVTQIPYLSPLFSDIVLAPMMRKLQTNKFLIETSKMLVGIVPMLENQKSGSVRDAFAIDPSTLGKFLNILRQSFNEIIKIGAAPFTDIKTVDFKTSDSNILQDYNKNLSAMSGINSRLIFSIDKPNSLETQSSIAVDEYLVLHVYHQFNQFMDYQINKRTKRFKFKFKFEGSEFPQNKKDRLENVLKLTDKGITLPQKIASALNMDVADFYRQLEEAKAMNFADKLTPLINLYNTTNKGGAPVKPDNEITESGIIGRDANSNNKD